MRRECERQKIKMKKISSQMNNKITFMKIKEDGKNVREFCRWGYSEDNRDKEHIGMRTIM